MTKRERAKEPTLIKWMTIMFMMLADMSINDVFSLGGDAGSCGFCVEYKTQDGHHLSCVENGCPLPAMGVCGVGGAIYAAALNCYLAGEKPRAIKLVEELLNIVESL